MTRNTLQQEVIRNIVKKMYAHPSSDDVYKEVQKNYPSISRATVYRVLNKLADKGEISKITMPNTADRFDFRTDNHIHTYCTSCGQVSDADIKQAKEMLTYLHDCLHKEHTTQLKNYEISKINISLEGICADCAQKQGGL